MLIEVYGTPAPQGSKKPIVVAGKARMVEDSKATVPWRQCVTHDALRAKREHESRAAGLAFMPFHEAVLVKVTFWMPRPKSYPKTLDVIPVTKPDIDKLQRSTFDGLTAAGIWTDDSLVAVVDPRKRYVVGPHLPKIYDPDVHRTEPGASIQIVSLGREW